MAKHTVVAAEILLRLQKKVCPSTAKAIDVEAYMAMSASVFCVHMRVHFTTCDSGKQNGIIL